MRVHRSRVFPALDGLRALAAICVVLYHLRIWFPEIRVVNQAYLAVDFFFILSGFIVSHAYGARLQNGLPAVTFLQIRAIRLYPLVILGTVAGAANNVFATTPVSAGELVPWVLLGALSIPILEGAGFARQFFPLNWPAWSLALELIVNAGYPWLYDRRRLLLIAGAILAAMLVVVAVYYGRINLGRGLMFIAAGLPRAAVPFILGIFLFAIHSKVQNRIKGASWMPIVSGVALLATFLPTIPRGPAGAAYDLVCVLIVYPVLIFIAAQSLAPRGGVLRFLGELSYPLYIMHFPLLTMFVFIARSYGVPRGSSDLWLVAASLGFMLAGVLLASEAFDRPVRQWLTRRTGVPQRTAAG